MNTVLLFSFKSDSVKVSIEAYFNEDDSLIIEGYDIGKSVEEIWGDSDYEYITTVKADAVNKLYTLLHLPSGSKDALLSYLQSRFNTNSCYSEIRTWFDENAVAYESFSWM